ncbi:uncharacterized protein LOC105628168 isoform X3 [Jatropha curcas]|uniref:uncharacterized protein LOC105628168 isoform X3 n=1 Tax=Jatropha curcas TaxID=180498 RepID=UPI001894067C|nr:uncharacterized protein LOC105628168 isoform X3 [Jatropha curcas]
MYLFIIKVVHYCRFENELIVAVGKGEPAQVMSEYGFKNVLSIDEYASYFDGIDPLAQYKTWTRKQDAKCSSASKQITTRDSVHSQRVQAAFIVSDSVDWSRDIQVLCDILRTGGLPGREIGHQPHLYFANDDLAYQVGYFSFRTPWYGSFQNCIRIHLQQVRQSADKIYFGLKQYENAITHVTLSNVKRRLCLLFLSFLPFVLLGCDRTSQLTYTVVYFS